MGMTTAYLGWQARVHSHRIVTFALDGKAQLPANLPGPIPARPIDDPKLAIDAAAAQKGSAVYNTSCASCHGGNVTAGGFAPDLRASPIGLSSDAFLQVVKHGTLETRGMPKYGELTDEQVEQLRLYLRQVARNALSAKGAVPFR